MNKKTVIIFLSIIMILCGCGKEETQSVSESPAPDYEEQKELISENYDMWKFDEYTTHWFYTFTDLDHNGRLEVIAATNEGTGLYTNALYFEVNETGTGLNTITTDLPEGDSWPDIISDNAECFFDETTGKYYYIYEDILRVSPAESYITKNALCLYNGNVERTLVSKKESIADTQKQTDRFYDAAGKEITENEFNTSADSMFSAMAKSQASFTWIEVENEIPREPSLIFAEDLYDGYGYVHQLCDETGVYDFAPINSDGVTWEVYILDEEFNDAERFIPQAYPCALKGSGSLTVNAGQWIYIYCPCNSWTSAVAPEGCAFSWGINPNK